MNPRCLLVQEHTLNSLTSFVIVGENFNPKMVEYKLFFDGNIDDGTEILVSSVLSQCTYKDGIYSFSLNPNRIDLRAHGAQEVMPAEFVKTIEHMSEMLDEIRSMVRITAIGLNCDTTIEFENSRNQKLGSKMTSDLLREELISNITDQSVDNLVPNVHLRWQDSSSSRYAVRIEPHVETQGDHLFVAINWEKNLGPHDDVKSILDNLSTFSEQVESIRGRVLEKS